MQETFKNNNIKLYIYIYIYILFLVNSDNSKFLVLCYYLIIIYKNFYA